MLTSQSSYSTNNKTQQKNNQKNRKEKRKIRFHRQTQPPPARSIGTTRNNHCSHTRRHLHRRSPPFLPPRITLSLSTWNKAKKVELPVGSGWWIYHFSSLRETKQKQWKWIYFLSISTSKPSNTLVIFFFCKQPNLVAIEANHNLK
jgi:hypothetical protein